MSSSQGLRGICCICICACAGLAYQQMIKSEQRLTPGCVHAGKAMLTRESKMTVESMLCKAAELSLQFSVDREHISRLLCQRVQLCYPGSTSVYADCALALKK